MAWQGPGSDSPWVHPIEFPLFVPYPLSYIIEIMSMESLDNIQRRNIGNKMGGVSPANQKPEEVARKKPATLEEWIEQEFSKGMMRRAAGEDVDMQAIPLNAPIDLVEKSLDTRAEDPEVAAQMSEQTRLMREALDYPDPSNPFSVWLERDRRGSRGARTEMERMLASPLGIKIKVENAVKTARKEREKVRTEKERLESPYPRLGKRLLEAQEALRHRGLAEDASHLTKLIQKLETADPHDLANLDIELWNGRKYENGKVEGWFPEEESRTIIAQALGTEYSGSNSSISPTKIEFWSSRYNTSTVKLDTYNNRVLEKGRGEFAYAKLVFRGQWFDKSQEEKAA